MTDNIELIPYKEINKRKSPEKKEEIKQKRREYNYNRYLNIMIAVSE